MASSHYKRLFLRSLAWDAEDASATLEATLKTAARAKITDTENGAVLVGTSGNGRSATFEIPRGLDPVDVAELCSELMDLYESSVATLGGAPTDAAILTQMLGSLEPIRHSSKDFSVLVK